MLVALCFAVALTGWLLRDGAEAIDVGAGASISCTPQTITYGHQLSCDTSSTVGADVVWGDGHRGGTTHQINLVGTVPIQLVADSGIVIAATEVVIEPDLALDCQQDEWKNIYEFAASDTNKNGWDYVYRHPSTGERIAPGHIDHPTDPGLTDLELVISGRAQETGECTATSKAADAFDGDITFTMGSKWEEHSVPFSRLTPYSDHHWKGTQPGYIDVSVTVNDHTVSERRDIYFSGCT